MTDAVPAVAAVGAFGTACASYAASAARGHARFVLGLHAGAALAYLGNALLFAGGAPGAGGASLLFVPLGVLLVAPWRQALAALPLAFAVARLGCLPSACCYPAWWAALPEIAGCLVLHRAARRWPRETPAIALSGFGGLRLLCLPLHDPAPASALIDPAWLAGAWLIAGIALRPRLADACRVQEGFDERVLPLLRALALLLAVWGLWPVSARLGGDGATAATLASVGALALLWAARPARPHATPSGVARLGLGWGVGLAVASGVAPAPPQPPALLWILALGVLAPTVEELLYREHLLLALRAVWGAPIAWLASSALFALSHPDLRVAPIAFAGGLVCSAVVLRSGSLATAIGLHAGWNLGVLV